MGSMEIIPHNKPSIGEEEIQAVTNVLQSGWIIAGKEVETFENSLKKYTGRKYAVAVSSGHAALHLCLLILGISEGDEVIIPAYTTPDLLNVIYYCKAVPVPVDLQQNTFVIDADKIKDKITSRTKAMIIPHLFGLAADIERIKQYGIPVIEDCAQAIGTNYRGKPVGFAGDLSIFSFYASKLITTGQGGMILTDNKKDYQLARDLIAYNDNPTYKIRYNYQLTNIAASIGNAQFPKLEGFIEKKKYIASQYKNVLQRKHISFWPQENKESNHFRFLIKLKNAQQRKQVIAAFEKKGITTIVPYKRYELPYIILGLDRNDFSNTEQLVDTTLSLPIFQALTEDKIVRIVNALEEIL
jgi:perosamine synthetase